MSFDSDSRDEIEMYQCHCCRGGNIVFNSRTGLWECDSCNFSSNGSDNGG